MKLVKFERSGAGEPGRPARVLEGNPTNLAWNITEDLDGELVSGYWEAQPGKWEFEATAWEFCHIISGEVVLTTPDGVATTMKTGDAFVMRPGLKCTWDVKETLLKHYVILGSD